ncbi:MAG: hypothetical protein AB1810_15090 [Pseudomonadota bacterium]
MSKIELQPSATALWHALVNDAEHALDQQLDPELESYLVFLLMRYADRPEIARKILAMEYLKGQLAAGTSREGTLREVGDTCLLYSGLYPHQADRRRVRVGYFVDLGRSAYLQLAETSAEKVGEMYHRLSEAFVTLMDVLRTIRDFCAPDRWQNLLRLHDDWEQTGSRHAQRQLLNQLATLPVRGSSRRH